MVLLGGQLVDAVDVNRVERMKLIHWRVLRHTIDLAGARVQHHGLTILLALAATHTGSLGFTSSEIVAFYLATYLPMTFICFLVLGAARAQGLSEEIISFRGLARRSPWLGFALTLALASLAGLPLTAGFMGKFFVFFTAALEGSYGSLLIAVIGAAAGFYYYFKVILLIHSPAEGESPTVHVSLPTKVAIAAFGAAIIIVGVYPDAIRHMLK